MLILVLVESKGLRKSRWASLECGGVLHRDLAPRGVSEAGSGCVYGGEIKNWWCQGMIRPN